MENDNQDNRNTEKLKDEKEKSNFTFSNNAGHNPLLEQLNQQGKTKSSQLTPNQFEQKSPEFNQNYVGNEQSNKQQNQQNSTNQFQGNQHDLKMNPQSNGHYFQQPADQALNQNQQNEQMNQQTSAQYFQQPAGQMLNQNLQHGQMNQQTSAQYFQQPADQMSNQNQQHGQMNQQTSAQYFQQPANQIPNQSQQNVQTNQQNNAQYFQQPADQIPNQNHQFGQMSQPDNGQWDQPNQQFTQSNSHGNKGNYYEMKPAKPFYKNGLFWGVLAGLAVLLIIIAYVLVSAVSSARDNKEEQRAAMSEPGATVELDDGTYKVGRDIAPGRYVITAESSSDYSASISHESDDADEVEYYDISSDPEEKYYASTATLTLEEGDKLEITIYEDNENITLTPVTTTEQTTEIGSGYWVVGEHVPAGRYVITTDPLEEGYIDIEGEDYFYIYESLTGDINQTDEGYVTSVTVDLVDGMVINISYMDNVHLTPVTERTPSTELSAGMWEVGVDIPAGTYEITTDLEQYGSISVEGSNPFYDSLSGDPNNEYDDPTSLTVTLSEGDIIVIQGMNNVHFKQL